MKNKEKVINYQNMAIVKQLNTMTAYGIGGLGNTPVPKEIIHNEDIETGKENSKE
ncbi:hypothetical protein [Candidatus Clostridium radicumherbarum]|uniref:Uncharacterized protein n=1 Tax=Candidatus Clostridium radicumherbarum TaxID=3381662 RepID=A0ABW8TNF1_9CLOT